MKAWFVKSFHRKIFAWDEGNKMYLLNTDYDMPVKVKVICGDKEEVIELESLELRALQL